MSLSTVTGPNHVHGHGTEPQSREPTVWTGRSMLFAGKDGEPSPETTAFEA